MSRNDKKRKKIRFCKWLELGLIKIRVTIEMTFFRKASIEKEQIDYELINELKKWSEIKNIDFSIRETEKNIYIRGHHSTQQATTTRHCIILFFSKVTQNNL